MPTAPDLIRRLGLLGLGIAVAAQIWVLYVPQPPAAPPFPFSDKVVHALIFAAPVFLALLAGMPPRASVTVIAAHAPISELIQHFLLTARSGDFLDVIADLVGVALGVVAVRSFGRLVGRRQSSGRNAAR